MDNEQILDNTKKQKRYMQVTMFCMIGILAIVLLAFILLVPQLLGIMDEVSQMSSSITQTSDSVNLFLKEHSQMLSETVEKVNQIDYESLNEAITDLHDAVEPFAKFINSFK